MGRKWEEGTPEEQKRKWKENGKKDQKKQKTGRREEIGKMGHLRKRKQEGKKIRRKWEGALEEQKV